MRIAIIGDTCTGKTKLVNILTGKINMVKYVTTKKQVNIDNENSIYQPTMGAEYTNYNDNTYVDCAGLQGYGGLRNEYFINTDIALLLFNDEQSYNNAILKWYTDYKKICPKSPVILINTAKRIKINISESIKLNFKNIIMDGCISDIQEELIN